MEAYRTGHRLNTHVNDLLSFNERICLQHPIDLKLGRALIHDQRLYSRNQGDGLQVIALIVV